MCEASRSRSSADFDAARSVSQADLVARDGTVDFAGPLVDATRERLCRVEALVAQPGRDT